MLYRSSVNFPTFTGNERSRPVEIDLPQRRETRYSLPCSKMNEVFDLLLQSFQEKSFSDNKIIRTIYFNNPEHEVPWGISLKARQYLKERINDKTLIDFNQKYFLEIKISNFYYKEKTRMEMSLNEATLALNEHPFIQKYALTSSIRPYVMDQYLRLNFVPKNGIFSDLRISCDFEPEYFLLHPDGHPTFLSKENAFRVEIKERGDSIDANNFISSLESLGASKVISKKNTAYWLESSYRKQNAFHLTKEIKDMEIESKMQVLASDPSLFFNNLVIFMRSSHKNFILSPKYQYVNESGSINSYYSFGDASSEGVKILSRPDIAKIVLKSEEEILPDKYNYGNILKRREIKEKYFPLEGGNFIEAIENNRPTNSETSPYKVGELERLRKGIWITNEISGRCYHITIDQCEVDNKKLFELEIEYTGIDGISKENPISEITNDISDITNMIIESFPGSAVPCRITKLNWLKENLM